MPERKLATEIDIDDDAGGSIEDLKWEILAQDICGQAARKYLNSLQDDMAQQAKMRKGSKKNTHQNTHLEFDFPAKRALDGMGKTFIVPYLHNRKRSNDRCHNRRGHLVIENSWRHTFS